MRYAFTLALLLVALVACSSSQEVNPASVATGSGIPSSVLATTAVVPMPTPSMSKGSVGTHPAYIPVKVPTSYPTYRIVTPEPDPVAVLATTKVATPTKAKVVTPPPSTPKVTKPAMVTTPPPKVAIVTAGAFCAEDLYGVRAQSEQGTDLWCLKASDGRNRWQAA